MAASCIAYSLISKPDISLRTSRWRKEGPPYEAVKPDEDKRLVRFHHHEPVDPEIEELKREVGSYKNE